MQQVGELLPVGSIVLLKGGTKKTMIMGVLQTDEEHPETVYDYMGIPYPEVEKQVVRHDDRTEDA